MLITNVHYNLDSVLQIHLTAILGQNGGVQPDLIIELNQLAFLYIIKVNRQFRAGDYSAIGMSYNNVRL